MSAIEKETAAPAEQFKSGLPDEPFLIGDWLIEPRSRRANRGEVSSKIDPRNLRVLQLLAANAGSVVSAAEIEKSAWQGVIVTPDSVYQSIRQLRRALQDTKTPSCYIETVPRRGYRLIAPVRTIPAGIDAPVVGTEPLDPIPSSTQRTGATFKLIPIAAGVGAVVIAGVVALLWRLDVISPATDRHDAAIEALTENVEEMRGDGTRLLGRLGVATLMQGDPEQARAYYQKGLDLQRNLTGEVNETYVSLLAALARAHFWLGDLDEAEQAARKAVAILDQLSTQPTPSRIPVYSVLGETLIGAGKIDEAAPFVEESLNLARMHYGEAHAATLEPLGSLAMLRFAQGRSQDAEQVGRSVIEIATRSRGETDPRLAHWHTGLAYFLLDQGKYVEAQAAAHRALDIISVGSKDDHPYALSAKHVLARILTRVGEFSEAKDLLEEELAALKTQNAEPWRIGRAESALAEVLYRIGRLAEAERRSMHASTLFADHKGFPASRERQINSARLQELQSIKARGDDSDTRFAKH